MNPVENLFYALGEFAYAIAKADGKIQKEESDKLHDILATEFKDYEEHINIPEIIFRILNKDHISLDTSYEWAVKEIKTNGHYMSEAMKQKFFSVLNKIAAAFPPSTANELNIIERLKKDIRSVKGDPVFTHEKK